MTLTKLLAGIVLLVPTAAQAQEVVVTVNPVAGTFSAEYLGSSQVLQLFYDITVRLTGDGPITITNESPVFTSLFTPSGAEITGNGTDTVTFVGWAPGLAGGSPADSSNPFEPFTFDYDGTFDEFGVEFYGLTSCIFRTLPFDDPIAMVNGNGTLGPLSFRIDIVPAPASALLLGLLGIGAAKRRR